MTAFWRMGMMMMVYIIGQPIKESLSS